MSNVLVNCRGVVREIPREIALQMKYFKDMEEVLSADTALYVNISSSDFDGIVNSISHEYDLKAYLNIPLCKYLGATARVIPDWTYITVGEFLNTLEYQVEIPELLLHATHSFREFVRRNNVLTSLGFDAVVKMMPNPRDNVYEALSAGVKKATNPTTWMGRIFARSIAEIYAALYARAEGKAMPMPAVTADKLVGALSDYGKFVVCLHHEHYVNKEMKYAISWYVDHVRASPDYPALKHEITTKLFTREN